MPERGPASHTHGQEPCGADMFASVPPLSFSWSIADAGEETPVPRPSTPTTAPPTSTRPPPPLAPPGTSPDPKLKFPHRERGQERHQAQQDRGRLRLSRRPALCASTASAASEPARRRTCCRARTRCLRPCSISCGQLRGQLLEKLRISYTHPMDDASAGFKIDSTGRALTTTAVPRRSSSRSATSSRPATLRVGQPRRIGCAAPTSLANRGSSSSSFIAAGAGGGSEGRSENSVNLDESFDLLSLGNRGCPMEPLRTRKSAAAAADAHAQLDGRRGTERYKYLFNIASRSDPHMDLFRFMGQMLGLAVRSKISVDIALPSLVWKYVARQTLTEHDMASFDVHAYQFTQHLASIHKRLRTASSASERSLISQEAQGILQDLTWSAVLSDGSVVDLMEGGRGRPVLLGELGTFLTAYTSARLQEAAPAMEAFRGCCP